MNKLTIKDNETNEKEKFQGIPNLTRKIRNKTLEELSKEGIFVFPETVEKSDDLEESQMILQEVNNQISSSNVMGFLGKGEERLVISSRFSLGEEDFFLKYLLKKVFDFPNITNLETDSSSDERIFDLLIFLFPIYLKNALRKGIFKTYIKREYNDFNVKGTIDINRHIIKNTPFVGKIAYNQREHSFDNYLTELIRHTAELIYKKSYGKEILARAKDEVKIIIKATPDFNPYLREKVLLENMKNPLRHAYYKEYRSLQNLCLLILSHQKHQIGFGSRKIYGVLFDGAWLWEEYVNLLIKDWFFHPMNKGKAGKNYLFSVRTGLIYPDFISRNKEQRIIADAKYKPIENICSRDYLQVLAYMFRFDAKKGYYIYPETMAQEEKTLFLNRGTSFHKDVSKRDDVCVIKYGIKIPREAKSFKEFSSKMEKEEDRIRNIIL